MAKNMKDFILHKNMAKKLKQLEEYNKEVYNERIEKNRKREEEHNKKANEYRKVRMKEVKSLQNKFKEKTKLVETIN